MDSNDQIPNLKKVTFYNRLLMMWYWLISFRSYYYVQEDRSLLLSDFDCIWNLLRTCDFYCKNDDRAQEMFIGDIMFFFDHEEDFRYIVINGTDTHVPRSISVLVKKKYEQYFKERHNAKKKNEFATVVNAYVSSKGI